MAGINMVFAGFGGQGILFAGKVCAYSGLMEEKEVSWLPSYGPEMRGGTANCSVCISDEPIGSPLVLTPDALIAMNIQSYDKFIDAVVPGGVAVIDSTLVDKKTERQDIKAFYVPATQMANDLQLQGLANIILLGKLLKETGFASLEAVEKAIAKRLPHSTQPLLDSNMLAIKAGMEA